MTTETSTSPFSGHTLVKFINTFLNNSTVSNPKLTMVDINKTAEINANIRNQQIERALARSRIVLLTLKEFMDAAGLKADNYVFDKFYSSIKEDIPIYLDNTLIQWCGYAGDLKIQKQNLIELMKKYNIKYMEYTNDEYEEFLSSQPTIQNNETLYPAVDRSNGKGRTKHIMLMPKEFRMTAMRLPTKKGEQVCLNYLDLEQIIHLYIKYQNEFMRRRAELLDTDLKESREKNNQLHNKVDKLNNKVDTLRDEIGDLKEKVEDLNDTIGVMSDKLDVATDERAPPTKNKSTIEKFVLVRLNDDDTDTYDYYVIRAQKKNANKSLRYISTRFPDAEEMLTFDYHPNSGNLYNHIKEQINDLIIFNGNYIAPIDCSPRGHRIFIKRIKKINNQRKEVELDE